MEIAFSSLNRDQKSPLHRPSVAEIGQIFCLLVHHSYTFLRLTPTWRGIPQHFDALAQFRCNRPVAGWVLEGGVAGGVELQWLVVSG